MLWNSFKYEDYNYHKQSYIYAIILCMNPEKTIIQKDTCTPIFIEAPVTIVRTWKQSRCPLTDEWIKKLWYIYTREYYSAIQRNECESVELSWMNLESVTQSEISHNLAWIFSLSKKNICLCSWRCLALPPPHRTFKWHSPLCIFRFT